ncbi:class I SAM-dependent methyltransferase [Amycolatopsis rhabdoformis]|uniref:Class I SAM-dependent methyltransferase n=1 Tax=Amycolatopsis rhabdoformis TaxID=1448059 RepID=A0ABZ1I8G2_9PSEU|nr:class I SAM-dependent methyltransferase [Amycolatopsis rhabdoformis]WSE30719.1 class I SAM-dependent methyltransferase [Amycolatopsis rhabdoformis]
MPEPPRSPAESAEADAVLTAAGPPAGRWVLVVGGGAGFPARLFRSAGAARVVGVDADRALIASAQRQEERDPLGISYEVHEPARLPVIGDFDVVVAFGVAAEALPHLAANVRPGGLLVLSRTSGSWESALADAGFASVEHVGEPPSVVPTARRP